MVPLAEASRKFLRGRQQVQGLPDLGARLETWQAAPVGMDAGGRR